MLDNIKDRLIMIILIVLIIVILIAGVFGYLFFVKNSNDNTSSKSTENAKAETSSQNTLSSTPENTINDQNNVNTNNLNQNTTNNNAPNGSLYPLNLGEVKEQRVTTNNGEESTDIINIDDFSLITSVKLKQVGYNMELTDNNTVLNIKSNDGLYSFKLIRLSNVTPYSLDENQETELDEILDRIAKAALSARGVTEDMDNYYDVYYEEYDNAKTSDEALNFYSRYGINRYTSMSGYTTYEILNIRNLLGVNGVEFTSTYTNDAGGMSKSTYIFNNGKYQEIEITEDMYPYNGIFMIVENYNGSEDDDYSVEFNFF